MKKKLLYIVMIVTLLVSACGVNQGNSELESSETPSQNSEDVSESVTDSETGTTTEPGTGVESESEMS
ncbi:MAG: hypothetical protein J6B96_00725, partial [Agathobacter sp.]|nr:hypothetical protein [Agathobacter sp.]